MPAALQRDIREESELIERFVRSYRRRFAAAIEQLNHRDNAAAQPELQALRLCVETMDMVLVNQDRLARALKSLSAQEPMLRAA